MLPSLREAEVSRASRTSPFPFRGHSYPRPEGSWLSGASSEGAWTSGWGWGWPEQPRFISFHTCPLLGSIMALLSSQWGPISFYSILTGPPPCASPTHSTGCDRERREGREYRNKKTRFRSSGSLRSWQGS